MPINGCDDELETDKKVNSVPTECSKVYPCLEVGLPQPLFLDEKCKRPQDHLWEVTDKKSDPDATPRIPIVVVPLDLSNTRLFISEEQYNG